MVRLTQALSTVLSGLALSALLVSPLGATAATIVTLGEEFSNCTPTSQRRAELGSGMGLERATKCLQKLGMLVRRPHAPQGDRDQSPGGDRRARLRAAVPTMRPPTLKSRAEAGSGFGCAAETLVMPGKFPPPFGQRSAQRFPPMAAKFQFATSISMKFEPW